MAYRTTYQLNSGFLLNAIGSLTTSADEVLVGTKSIKGSYDGTGNYTPYLQTDTSVLRLEPNATYQVSFNYKILATPSAGFEVLFYSPASGAKGNFLNSTRIEGVGGDTGTVSLTSTLANFTDYQARWNVVGTGAIAIDEIKITNLMTGKVIATEDAEEGIVSVDPGIALLKSGLINDVARGSQLTLDFSQYASSSFHSYFYRSSFIADFNRDGQNEVLFTVTPYVQYRVPVVVLGNENNGIVQHGIAPDVEDLTKKYFPAGAPTPMNAESIVYKDINGDGLKDLVFSETGLDSPPWTGAKISVALGKNNSNQSIFLDVSSEVPDTTMRSYAIAVGDFNADGTQDILLGDQETYGTNTWSGSDKNESRLLNYIDDQFIERPNPVTGWANPQNRLPSHTYMTSADFNGDGRDDLLVTNSWSGANATIIFGGKNGLDETTLKRLPPGPLGQGGFDWAISSGKWPLTQIVSGNETRAAVYDFNRDGRPDIFGMQNEYVQYPPGVVTDNTAPNYQDVLKNGGGLLGGKCAFYTLINVDGNSFQIQNSCATNMPSRLYDKLLCEDVNSDGYMDVIGHYFTFPRTNDDNGALWSTTFFMNDGNGNFTAIEGVKAFPQLATFPYLETSRAPQPEVGAIFPLKTEGGIFTGLQVLPEVNQAGKFTAAEFTTAQARNLKADVTSQINSIVATSVSRTVIGSAGVDVLTYMEPASHYTLSLTQDSITISDTSTVHSLRDVERIRFSDKWVAVDLGPTQAAGLTSKTLGAVFGKAAVANKEYVGIGLHFMDDLHYNYNDLMQLAITARLGANPTNAQVVDLLYTNVVGVSPSKSDRDYFVGLLDNHAFTTASLGMMAADTDLNKTNINFTGLAHTGLEFQPFTS